MNEHYVYFYIDPRDGRVFYVGCGKGRRMWVHLRPSVLRVPSPKSDMIRSILAEDLHPMIVVVEWGLSQVDSLNSERKWIAFYGKENLTNKTTGGQGVAGTRSFLGRHHTDKAKERIRQSKLGKANPMFGKHRTAEALRKFSEKIRGEGHPQWGKHVPDATKEKIRAKLSGFQWSDGECVKRSIGMSRVWEERRKTGIIPKHKKRTLMVGGVTKTLDEWSEQSGVKKSTLRARLAHGWKPEDAVGVTSNGH